VHIFMTGGRYDGIRKGPEIAWNCVYSDDFMLVWAKVSGCGARREDIFHVVGGVLF